MRLSFIPAAVLIIFLALPARGVTVLIEWAMPLKHGLTTLSGVLTREYAGVTLFDGMIVTGLRDGRFVAFTLDGSPVCEKDFDGDIVIPAVVAGEKKIAVTVSNSLYLLDAECRQLWVYEGKAPIVSAPFVTKEGIYLQFSDNSIALIDKETGALRVSYSYYIETPLSYVRLQQPFKVDDKVVVGFSNGLITWFMYKKNEDGSEEILPYYKFKTSKGFASLDKREFYDVFSMLPMEEDLLFSNGETGGIVLEGAVIDREKMQNLQLSLLDDGKVLGFGERGAFVYSPDGIMERQVFDDTTFVTNAVHAGQHYFFTDEGDYGIFYNTDGKVFVYDEALSRLEMQLYIPRGVSGPAVFHNGRVYLVSNKGVLYAFRLVDLKKN